MTPGFKDDADRARATAILLAHRGPLTPEGRQKILEALARGRATAIENRKKRAVQRKADEAFRKRFARASWSQRPRSRTP